MQTVDLHSLAPGDIPAMLDALQRYFTAQGLTLITDNIFLKPESLAKRWELSLGTINNWRLVGGGPLYMKAGPGIKAPVRYPMLGKDGIMAFEQQQLFSSTSQSRGP